MTEGQAKLQLARESYLEALDATKHQDDKIGRFLSAIAFLTGGALVFFDRGVLVTRYRLGGSDLPLGAWALGAFLFFVALSVLLLILSLATPLALPVSQSRPRLGSSHIFFIAIAAESDRTWEKMWSSRTDHWLREAVGREYITEARNLAVRADKKYARTREGATLFIAGMVFFALAVILAVDSVLSSAPGSLSAAPPSGGVALPWTAERRLVIGLTLAVFSATMLYYQFRSAQRLSDMVERRRAGADGLRSHLRIVAGDLYPIGFVAVLWPVFVTATAIGNGGRPWLSSGGPVVILSGATAVVLTTWKLHSGEAGRVAQTMVATVGGLLVGWAAVSIWNGAEDQQIAVAVAAVLLTLAGNFFDATVRLNQRLEAHSLLPPAANAARPAGTPRSEPPPAAKPPAATGLS